MIKDIYLIRHGLTESNKRKIYAGWSEESLCEEGIHVLLEIAKKLKEFRIERIFSSPIRRAVQTAEILSSLLNRPVEIEEDFKEMKIGLWEGLSETEVIKKFPKQWEIWNTTPSILRISGREFLEEVQLRALKRIERMVCSNGLRDLVVTHVAIIRVLIIYYNKLSMDDYRGIEIPNGAVYLLDDRKQKKKIERVM